MNLMTGVLLFQLINLFSQGFAQDLIFENLSVNEGLPSSEVYDIYQDARGNLWFCTDNGIARYDGNEIKSITLSEGLPEEVVFNFFEISSDKVCIATISNRIYFFNPLARDPIFYDYPFNDTLAGMFRGSFSPDFIRNLWLDEEGNLTASMLIGGGELKINQDGRAGFSKEPAIVTSRLREADIIIHVGFSDVPYCVSEMVDRLDPDAKLPHIFLVDDQTGDTLDTGLDFESKLSLWLGVADWKIYDGKISMILGRYMITYDRHRISRCIILPFEGLRILEFNDRLCVGTRRGLYCYSLEGDFQEVVLPENVITFLHEDFEGGFWIGTIENGVYYTRSTLIREFKHDAGTKSAAKAICIGPDFVFRFSQGNSGEAFSRSGLLIGEYSPVEYSFGSIRTPDGSLEKYFGPPCEEFSFPGAILFRHPRWYKGTVPFIFSPHYVNWFTDEGYHTENYDEFTVKECFAVNDSSTYLATDLGPYTYSFGHTPVKLPVPDRLQGMAINDIIPFQGGLIVSGADQSIVYFRDTSDCFALEPEQIGAKINGFRLQSDSVVWGMTNRGLILISWVGDGAVPYLKRINTNNGLLGDEVLDLQIFRDTVWVNSKNGICFFSSRQLDFRNEFNPDFFCLDSVYINQEYYDRKGDTLVVEYGDLVQFFFRQATYRYSGPLHYEYTVDPECNNWRVATTGEINYLAKETGYVTVTIRPGGFLNREAVLKLVILTQAPFWYEWWFYLISLAIIALLTVVIFKWMMYRNNLRKEREISKLKLEMRSLLAQMNPHFTFNTINAIQYYLVQNSTRDAVLYLADFALLIRKTLEFSRLEIITVSNEVEFLKLYTELENKRFGFSFEVVFEVRLLGAEETTPFPSLLIQPIVENAIIHGVSSMEKGTGKVKISIVEHDSFFMISVSDNGPGIKAPVKERKRKSFGIEIFTNRVKLYNGKSFNPSDVAIFASGENGEGMKVVIKLYKNFHESADNR